MITLHLKRRTLLAFDAHEMGTRGRRRSQNHLAGCPRCRAHLTRLRGLRSLAGEVTAPDAPHVLGRIEARLRSGEIVLLPVPDVPAASWGTRPGTRRSVVAAAVALTVLAGSVAAAVAVSPLGEWVRTHVPAIGGARAPERVEPMAGVAVPVGPAGVVIDLRGASGDVRVRMSIGGSDLLDIVGVGAAATAEYRSAEGRVTVTGLSGGELRVVVPAGAAGVTLMSGPDTLVAARPEGLRMPDGSTVQQTDLRLADLLRPAGGIRQEDREDEADEGREDRKEREKVEEREASEWGEEVVERQSGDEVEECLAIPGECAA
jgi:hypothetical protein